MSEQMERVERWYLVDKFGPSTYGYATEAEAIAECTSGHRIIHLVELRENEQIGVDLGLEKREPLVPDMSVADRIETSGERVEPMGERTRSRLIPERELNAAIERAEKAESALKSFQPIIGGPTSLADWTTWKSRALAAESALNDERERYRREVIRESYQRMLGIGGRGPNVGELKAMGLTFEQYCAREAKAEAAVITDAAFGFPPAKEV